MCHINEHSVLVYAGAETYVGPRPTWHCMSGCAKPCAPIQSRIFL